MNNVAFGKFRGRNEVTYEDVLDENGRLIERKVKSWNGNEIQDEHKIDDTRRLLSEEARLRRNQAKMEYYYKDKAKQDALRSSSFGG